MTLKEIFIAASMAKNGGASVSPEQIEQSVESYLERNPVETYTLPVATATTLGGVKPVAVTDEMTEPVGVDASGQLFTKPGEGGGGETWEHICDIAFNAEDALTKVTQDLGGEYKKLFLYVSKGTGGLVPNGGADTYVLEVFANSQSNADKVARLISAQNAGWVNYEFLIEWNQDIQHSSGVIRTSGLTYPSLHSITRTTPYQTLIFVTDGTHPTSGTVYTFDTFTMNVYGVRA